MRTGACIAGPSDCAGEIASAIADRWFLTPARAKPFAGLAARSISHCEARETGRRLYLLFVREQRFMTEQDTKRKWQEDPEASEIFANAREKRAIINRFSAPLLLLIDNLHALGRRAIAMSDRLTNRQTRLHEEWLVTPSRR